MKEYCGVVGVYGHKDASQLAYLSLYALQHRGEESCGITSYDGKKIHSYKSMGLVGDVFKESIIKKLKGSLAVGHVRYSTTGSSDIKNAQPFTINYKKGHISLAHNGNITNSDELRMSLENNGSIFQTTMDSEIIVHLLVQEPKLPIEERFSNVMCKLEGAFSLVVMADDSIYGVRDPFGFRPLCIGKLGDAYVIVSETCALDITGAEYLRDIEPGEIVKIDKKGITSLKYSTVMPKAFCIFENIYFSRPDSRIFGSSVYQSRKNLGIQLAKEHPMDADFVMPVPDSGNVAAIGYAEESGLPLEMGFIRNHYIGRTFIQPSQMSRDFKVKVKLNPVTELVKDRKIVIVEDSIVRGTTSKGRVRALRKAGAKEIHMRVSCPPLVSPCYYGIDFPTRKELVASNHSEKQIADFIGVDSLRYLSLNGMLNAMDVDRNNFCTACFTGKYPTSFRKKPRKNAFEK
ncbi:MAG: amidophosphoribosyltransferase [Candidatus Aureabacteria bacterium]|nr:amidophosphoribosyltransferase [Candidatus Auribacterota bacterium]